MFQLSKDYGKQFHIAISRTLLVQAAAMLSELTEGPFDIKFKEYGWEDLELGGKLCI